MREWSRDDVSRPADEAVKTALDESFDVLVQGFPVEFLFQDAPSPVNASMADRTTVRDNK